MSYEFIAATVTELDEGDAHDAKEIVNVVIEHVGKERCIIGTVGECFLVSVEEASDYMKKKILQYLWKNLPAGIFSKKKSSDTGIVNRSRALRISNPSEPIPSGLYVAAPHIVQIVNTLKELGQVREATHTRTRGLWGEIIGPRTVELIFDKTAVYGQVDATASQVIKEEDYEVRAIAEACEQHVMNFFRFILNDRETKLAESFRNDTFVLTDGKFKVATPEREYREEDFRYIFPERCEVAAFVIDRFLDLGYECMIVRSRFDPDGGNAFNVRVPNGRMLHQVDAEGKVNHAHLKVTVHGVEWCIDPVARGFGTGGPTFWKAKTKGGKKYYTAGGAYLGSMIETSDDDDDATMRRDYRTQYVFGKAMRIVGAEVTTANILKLYYDFLQT